MTEKEIEKILASEVKKLGGRAYKWVSPGNDGVPDRVVIFSGRPAVFVELKSDTGKLSAVQQIQIQRLQDLGQAVFVVKGIAGVSQFFHGLGYNDTSRALDKKYGL